MKVRDILIWVFLLSLGLGLYVAKYYVENPTTLSDHRFQIGMFFKHLKEEIKSGTR